ncbi:hypothetical protein Vretifemale_11621, partial [Volvox reticuliferus]
VQESPPPPPPSPPPPPVKEFQAYKLKNYVYIFTTTKYTYDQAADFCYAKGYVLVPYNKREHKEATDALCYNSGRGCWTNGKQGNHCAYIDPNGGGGAYVRYCNEEQYALCYGKWP